MATAEGLALDELVAPMHFSPQLEAAIQEVRAPRCKRPAHGVPAPSAQGCRLQHTGPTPLLCGLGAPARPPNSPHTPAPCAAGGGLLAVWVTGSRVLRETTRQACPRPSARTRLHLSVHPFGLQVMPSTDPLDAADFNPTAHINRLFPNEESLAEVDAHVGGLQERMRELDEEVLRTVRQQTSAGSR